MNKKVSILFIIIGILWVFIVSGYFSIRYPQQSNWIRAESILSEIKYSEPASPTADASNGGWYGEYIYDYQGKQITLTTYPVSSESLVKENEVFYINPNDFNNYHLEYSKYSVLRGLSGLVFVFIGIIGICLSRRQDNGNSIKTNDITK